MCAHDSSTDRLRCNVAAMTRSPEDPRLERPVPLTAFERRFKHPPGLVILFFAEMWERFSYYGMRGLLKLYMANYLFVTARESLQGCKQRTPPCDLVQGNPDSVFLWNTVRGLLPENPAEQASLLYGTYTALVYATPFFGGILADRVLGQRKTVVVGGLLMAAGHFVMASEDSFFLALGLLIFGNGAFKPNISTQVGNLYAPGDPRRDGAFTIFYMGINLGAFICNLVCGTLAVVYGWHYGFAAAGVGMLLGLTVYLLGQKHLAPDNLSRLRSEHRQERSSVEQGRAQARARADRALRAQHRVLGSLRAAGQHHADLGRRAHHLARDLRLPDALDLVPVAEPVPDHLARAAARHVLAASGPDAAKSRPA